MPPPPPPVQCLPRGPPWPSLLGTGAPRVVVLAPRAPSLPHTPSHRRRRGRRGRGRPPRRHPTRRLPPRPRRCRGQCWWRWRQRRQRRRQWQHWRRRRGHDAQRGSRVPGALGGRHRRRTAAQCLAGYRRRCRPQPGHTAVVATTRGPRQYLRPPPPHRHTQPTRRPAHSRAGGPLHHPHTTAAAEEVRPFSRRCHRRSTPLPPPPGAARGGGGDEQPRRHPPRRHPHPRNGCAVLHTSLHTGKEPGRGRCLYISRNHRQDCSKLFSLQHAQTTAPVATRVRRPLPAFTREKGDGGGGGVPNGAAPRGLTPHAVHRRRRAAKRASPADTSSVNARPQMTSAARQ